MFYNRCEVFFMRNGNKDYIEKNIPQGRGMIKWLPMATMPEQYRRIANILDEQDMISPPIHDDDTRIRLEESIRNSLNSEVVLRYWSTGYEVQIKCRIEFIEQDSQFILVSKENEYLNIEFKHIYDLV